ncbi:MAG: hypothetical protein P1U74_04570 [Legionellaceae bacterium]|nr:hypothetical protein [Legionellaceae bacterium]
MKIFISTAPSDQSKTGDVDYAHALANQLNMDTTNNIEVIHLASREITQQSIINQVISEKKTNSHVIFHLIINGDGSFEVTTGGTIKPESLAYMKKHGVRIIITCLEFSKWSISLQPSVVKNWEKYFFQAERVIFVDEEDKKTAIKRSNIIRSYEMAGKISVLSIPTTLTQLDFSQLLPLQRRDKNFLCFGIIRPFKGIEKFALPLAKILKSKSSDKKVLVVGSISDSYQSSSSLLTNMLQQSYGSNESVCREIDNINTSENLSENEKCGLLIKLYEKKLKYLTADINVEFHFDVSEKNLAVLFNRCRYALNFNFKGVSPHFSSVTNTLMAQMKNYGLDLYMTPLYFKEEGEFLTLAKTFKVNNGYPEEGDISFDSMLKIANEIIRDTELIEVDNIYPEEFKLALSKFCQKNPIDIKAVCKKLHEIYVS